MQNADMLCMIFARSVMTLACNACRGFQKLIARKPINYFLSNQSIEFSQTNKSNY